MGTIVGAFAASHSPGVTGWPERAEPRKREIIEAAYREASRRIEALQPDAIVAISVEHFTNFNFGNLPAFAIATADSYLGPVTPEMAEFLKVPQHQYPGNGALGRHIYEYAIAQEFDPALVEGGLDFDENFCVPLNTPGSRIPIPARAHHRERRQPALAHGQAQLRVRGDDPARGGGADRG